MDEESKRYAMLLAAMVWAPVLVALIVVTLPVWAPIYVGYGTWLWIKEFLDEVRLCRVKPSF
jgi:hypothetical protein